MAFKKLMKFTFDWTASSGSTAITNFPIPIANKNTPVAIIKCILGNCQEDGRDLRIVKFGGDPETEWLPYQIRQFNRETNLLEVYFSTDDDINGTPRDFEIYGDDPDASDFSDSSPMVDYFAVYGMDAATGATDYTDYSGNGYDLTVEGDPQRTDGIIGFAQRLDGRTDKGVRSRFSELVNSDMTTSTWIRRRSASIGAINGCMGQGDNVTNQGFQMGYQSDNKFKTGFWGTANDLNSAVAYNTAEEWELWTFRFTASTKLGELFRNGILENSKTLGSVLVDDLGDFNLGRVAPKGSDPLQGDMDESRLSAFALDVERIELEHDSVTEEVITYDLTFESAGWHQKIEFAINYDAGAGSTSLEDAPCWLKHTSMTPAYLDTLFTGLKKASKDGGDIRIAAYADSTVSEAKSLHIYNWDQPNKEFLISFLPGADWNKQTNGNVIVPFTMFFNKGGISQPASDEPGGSGSLHGDDCIGAWHTNKAYSVDEAVQDITGLNDGVFNEGSTVTASSLMGPLATFSNTDSRVKLGDLETDRYDLNNAGGKPGRVISGVATVKYVAGDMGNSSMSFGKRKSSSGYEGWEFGKGAVDKLFVGVDLGSNVINRLGNTTLIVGNEYRIGFEWTPDGDSANINLYLQGAVDNGTPTGNYTTNVARDEGLSLGSRNDNTDSLDLQGSMGDTRLFSVSPGATFFKADYALLNDNALYIQMLDNTSVGNNPAVSGWGYSQNFSFNSQSAYLPIRITEAVLVPNFLIHVSSDGAEVRAVQGGIEIPIHKCIVDKVLGKAEIWVYAQGNKSVQLKWDAINLESIPVSDADNGHETLWLSDGFTARYTGQERSENIWRDSTGNENDLIWQRDIDFYSADNIHTANELNKSLSDYGVVPDDASGNLDMGTGPFTLWAQFRFSDVTLGDQVIIGKKDYDGASHGYELELEYTLDGKIWFNCDGTTAPVKSDSVALSNTDYFIICKRDAAGLMSMYINGVKQADTLTYTADIDSVNELRIGSEEASGEYFDGPIGDIGISKGVALSDELIEDISENVTNEKAFFGLEDTPNLNAGFNKNMLGGFQR